MIFLTPWTGVIVGAVAAPVLVALYLLKLRRRAVRVSSTLLWEEAVRDMQANVPLRWVRVSLLLLVQMLALVALLMALSRPALRGSVVGGRGTVLIVDRSASMSAVDGEGMETESDAEREGGRTPTQSRLERAKGMALGVIDEMERGESGAGMVMALGAETRAVTGFTSDWRELREAVRSIKPSDQPGRLGPALELVESLSAGEEGAGEGGRGGKGAPTALLFSDGGFGDWPAGAGRLTLVPVGGQTDQTGVDNLGIVAISARRDFESPERVRVFVRVVNSGKRGVETSLRAAVDGASVGSERLVVPGGVGGAPGEGVASLEFEWDRGGGGVLTVTIPREDALASDNTAAMVLRPVTRARVLLVAPDEKGADPFLASVLGALELSAVEPIDAGQYERGVESAGERGARGRSWPGFDLIVFDRVRPRVLPAQPTISFGAGLPIAGLTVEAGEVGSATRVVSWRRTHPLLRYAALDGVVVSPAMRMELPTSGEGGGEVTELALGERGALIGLIGGGVGGGGGVGRIVVGFELSRSNWGPEVSFPVFLSSAVDLLTGRGDASAGRSYTTGEGVSVELEPGEVVARVTGPVEFAVERAGEQGVVSLGIPERAGIYSVGGAVARDSTLCVNLVDAGESSLGGAADLGNEGARGNDGAGRGGGLGGGLGVRDGAGRREVWHWFVIVAAVLLGIEWFVFAWKMRA